ncbi:hypothetical protein, conserved [Leishmania tarentolae]|uniref:Uncharacterized protein n=1 Tax=Leishmania tarentolae TaxID=5689 RepID=A0A640KRI9_LEITA|nr:hypothetical protein, conserved [Leishmania tarentolae]
MQSLSATPVREAPVLVSEEASKARTIEMTAATYSEVESSPAPFTWGSESASASLSPASGNSHHRFHPIRKTFARSVAPTTKGANSSPQASNVASSPVSGTQLLSTSTGELSPLPASPSPVRDIIDFYLSSSRSPHSATQYSCSHRRECEEVELKCAADTRAGPESTSLSSSQASERFCRSLVPARAYIEDLLALTDEDGNSMPPQVETAPVMGDSSGVKHESISLSSRVVRVALDNSPVVPEMWEETSSSASTSSTRVSDGFEKAEDSQQRQRSVPVAHTHLSVASSSSPLPAELTVHPIKLRQSVENWPPSQRDHSYESEPSAPTIEEEPASSSMAVTKASSSATMLVKGTKIGLSQSSRCLTNSKGNFPHREAVERMLCFPPYMAQEEDTHMNPTDREQKDEGAKTVPAFLNASPVVSDDAAGHCSGQRRAQGSPSRVPALSARQPSHFPPSPPVDKEMQVAAPSLAGNKERLHPDAWLNEPRAGRVAVPRLTQADNDLPAVKTFLSRSASSFPLHPRRVEPPLLRYVDLQVATSEPHQPPNCPANKPTMRALLSRLYPRLSPSTRPDTDSGIVSHESRGVLQIPPSTAVVPPPRWNVSTKVHFDPLTGSMELAYAGERHSSLWHGSGNRSKNTCVGKRPVSAHRHRSTSAPAKAPLHTRTSLLRLEATKAREVAAAALREEVESPSFHPTVAPHTARLCRSKLRELKSLHSAGAGTGAAPGFPLEQASRAENSKREDVKGWQGTSGQALVSNAVVVADVSASTSDDADSVGNAQTSHSSILSPAALPGKRPSPPRVTERCGTSSSDGARMYPDVEGVQACRQATQYCPSQERKPEEKPCRQTFHHLGASSCAMWPSAEDLDFPKPPDSHVSAATSRVSASAQCNLLSSEHMKGPAITATPGFDVQLGPTAIWGDTDHASRLAVLPKATQTALQRVDLYSTTPTGALEARATASERQQRVENRLQELDVDQRRRLAMLRRLSNTRDSVTGQFFNPFKGR